MQKNMCGDFANSAAGRSAGTQVAQCDEQNGESPCCIPERMG